MPIHRIPTTIGALLAAAVLTAAPAPGAAVPQSVPAGTADAYSEYPGGAAGYSNGELTAGQKGEPLGAGGTSAGSSSPFARAGAQAPSIAFTPT